MKAHPYADLFPMMSDAERNALLESVRRDGLLHPIITYQGQILDGRNRYSVCHELGVMPRFDEFTGGDALRFVMASNAARRQMRPSQLAMVAARLANMGIGGGPERRANVQICTLAISLEDAATMLGVSRRSAATARKVIAEASADVVAAVDA